MRDRRSGVDLLYCDGGWAVVYGTKLLSLHESREAAIRDARVRAAQVLAARQRALRDEPAGGGDEEAPPANPVEFPRLRTRRHPRTYAG
jgi:hypothetical protein